MEIYLRGCEFNEARVIERMADKIIANGGKIKTVDDGITIQPYGYHGKIMEIENRIERFRAAISKNGCADDAQLRFIKKLEKEKSGLEKKKKSAKSFTSRFMTQYGFCGREIKYMMPQGEMKQYIYFSFADNPFFPDTYQKVILNADNTYFGRYYVEQVTGEDQIKEYYVDDMWSIEAKDETIEYVANAIMSRLAVAPYSERVVDKKRMRVPNTYNHNWHWETVTTSDNTPHKVEF